MRRWSWAVAGILLVGCGGTGGVPSVSQPAPTADTTATASAVALATDTAKTAASATITRTNELNQIATLTAPTALAASPTPAPLVPTSTAVPPTEPSVPSTPTIAPTTVATSSTSPSLVVTVIADGTGDSINVRSGPDMGANVLTRVRPRDDLRLHDTSDAVSGDGQHWVKIDLNNGEIGYVRRDLVSGPHASSGVAPTPVLVATQVASSQSPTSPAPFAGAKGTLTPDEIMQRTKYERVEIRDLSRYSSPSATSFVRIEGTVLTVQDNPNAKVQAVYMVIRSIDSDYASVTVPGTVSQFPKGSRIAAYGLLFGTQSVGVSSGGSITVPYILAQFVDVL